MEIIGAEAAGAGAQTDQPAAPGEKKEGAGGLFGLVLARLAGDGDADEKEGGGAEPPSTDAAGPVSLAGLLVPAALQQVEPSASPVPTSVSADAPDTVLAVALAIEDGLGQGGASAGSLPSVPAPVAPLASGADQAPRSSFDELRTNGESELVESQVGPGSEQAEVGVEIMGRGNGVRTRFLSGSNQSPLQLKTGPDTVSADSLGADAVEPGQLQSGPDTVFTDAGGAESDDERGTAPEETPSADGPSGEAGETAALRDGTGAAPVETALGDAVRHPAMDHVPFGSEKLAAENLSAPPPASSTAASAPVLSRAVPPVPDPAPVAGNAFQRDMLQIQLPPSDLGRITMQVSVHARQVQAAVSVEHQGLGAYLAAGQGALDDAVRQHGLRVEEFRVDLLDLGAGRTGQGQDSPEFHGRQDALPGRPLPVAVPPAQTGFPPEGEPEEAAALRRINVFA